MDEIEDKAITHAIAISIMHDQRKGILSHQAYSMKQNGWVWTGACIATFSSFFVLRSFGIHDQLAGMLCAFIALVIGGVIGGMIFESQFVEDKSLEPLGLWGKSQCPNIYCKSCGKKSHK